jgi:hypothetical protein
MKHPGFYRAVPGAILGFVIGEVIIFTIRSLQGLDPWDPGVAIVLAGFTMMAGWMWGVGAFNPKLSEHGEHHAEDEATHEADDRSAGTIFFTEIWKAATLPLLLLLLVFAFAHIPGGFFMQIANDPEANAAVFDNSVMLELPIFGTVETTQMVIFLTFVAWLMVSLIAFAGILGFLMYKGHEQVMITQAEPTLAQLTPPAPLRSLGRGAKGLAAGLRKNLPKIFGQR